MSNKVSDNIFLVVADTLSAFNMGYYGYEKNTTPFLDKLAENNFVADFGYSTAPWTVPSHASLFTGKLPYEHGTTSQDIFFDDISLAEEMSDKGYETIGISNNALISPEIGFDRGFDNFYFGEDIPLKAKNLKALKHVLDVEREGNYSNAIEKYSDFLLKVIRNRDTHSLRYGGRYIKAKISSKDGPKLTEDSGASATNQLAREKIMDIDQDFFMFLNYMEPHEPYKPPSDFGRKFLENYSKVQKKYLEEIYPQLSINRSVEEDLREDIISLYDAEIRYLDSKLEELWDFINEELDDFVFIVVGDHGENLGHYGMWDHQYGIWERLVRVPIIIAGEDIPNTRIDDKVSIRALNDFIQGNKDIYELGNNTIFAEYYGADGFFRNFGRENPEDISSEKGHLVHNKSKMMMTEELGVIHNTEIDNFIFKQNFSNFSMKSIEDVELEDLDKIFQKELNDEIEDVDV